MIVLGKYHHCNGGAPQAKADFIMSNLKHRLRVGIAWSNSEIKKTCGVLEDA